MAFAQGLNCIANNSNSVCFGDTGTSIGVYSTVLNGLNCKATGDYSICSGSSNTASGTNSLAIGVSNTASGTNSLAIGTLLIANGNDIFSFGRNYLTSIPSSFNIGFGQLDYEFKNFSADFKDSNLSTTGMINTTNFVNAKSYKILNGATAGTILRGNGTDYINSTSTFANTFSDYDILYSNEANTIEGLHTANNSVLITDAGGSPAWQTSLPTATTIATKYIYRTDGTDVAVADGGTGKSSWTANGVVYASGTGTLANSANLDFNGNDLVVSRDLTNGRDMVLGSTATVGYMVRPSVVGSKQMVTCVQGGSNLENWEVWSTAVKFTQQYTATVGATNRDLYIDNTGLIGYVSSSERYKENIVNASDTSWIYKLRPVDYDYKSKSMGSNQTGLIAEEVAQVNPRIVSYKRTETKIGTPSVFDKNGTLVSQGNETTIYGEDLTTPETVNYGSSILISSMIKELQNLKTENNQIKSCTANSKSWEEYQLCVGGI
jgi:hypothetical protein